MPAQRLVTTPLSVRVYDRMNLFTSFIVQTLPGTLYFASYLLLFFYWAAVYHRAVRLFSKDVLRSIFFAYCIIVACSLIVLVGLGLHIHVSGRARRGPRRT